MNIHFYTRSLEGGTVSHPSMYTRSLGTVRNFFNGGNVLFEDIFTLGVQISRPIYLDLGLKWGSKGWFYSRQENPPLLLPPPSKDESHTI